MTPTLLALFVLAGAFSSMLTLGLAWQAATTTDGPEEGPSAVLAEVQVPWMIRGLAVAASSGDPHDREHLRRRLDQAGVHDPAAVWDWLALRTVTTLLAPAFTWMAVHHDTPLRAAGAVGIAAIVGYFVPELLLRFATSGRKGALRQYVPDMLDMLVSCMEAGLGTDAAFRHVARELRVACPPLADELDIANAQLTAGIPRHEALRRLDERTGIDELGALVGVLGQAERFGAGVAPSLRAHAQLSRRRRALDAEQRAARASPLLTVVMIVFILPALFVVLVGPAMIHIMTRLVPTLGG